MTLAATIRAVPTLFRVGFISSLAYRAELLVWMLAMTMPFVMLALYSSVAAAAPIGRFGSRELTTYFLGAFLVRQMVSAWAAWEINMEVRSGALSTRLLRPLHPVVSYATENLAALPLRSVIAIPIAIVLLFQASGSLAGTTLEWLCVVASVLGGWLITFFAHCVIGILSVWLESSLKLLDVWVGGFLLFSGYLTPVELFPPAIRSVVNVLPFRFQVGFSVEVITRAHSIDESLRWLGFQWCYVLVFGAITWFAWNRAMKHFAAYGG